MTLAVIRLRSRITCLLQRCVLFSYVNFDNPGEVRDAAFFFGVIVISTLFSGYYGIHSVLSVNYMELAAYRVLTLWLLIRLCVEYYGRADTAECRDLRGSITCLAFLCVGAALNVLTIGITFFMLNDLRWKRYKAVGADVDTQIMYRRFELFSAVRKVDLQFSLVTLFTGLVYCSFNLTDVTAQYTLGANVALIAIEGLWEWLGDTGVKGENDTRMYLFWGLSVFLPSFIVNVAIDAFTDNSILRLASTPAVRITIGVFGLLAVVNRILTVGCSILLYRAFGTERYAGLRRIFEGGRMQKFGRGRMTGGGAGTSSSTAAAVGGGGAAPSAAGRLAAGAPAQAQGGRATVNPASGAVLKKGASASGGARSAGVGQSHGHVADASAVELEMGDLGSGARDPWATSSSSSSSGGGGSTRQLLVGSSARGVGAAASSAGLEDYASSASINEWSPSPKPRGGAPGTPLGPGGGGAVAPNPFR